MLQQLVDTQREFLETNEMLHLENNFNNEIIKKKVFSKNSELIEFLKKIYLYSIEGEVNYHFTNIKNLEYDVLKYGIIRMKTLENSYKNSRIASVISITILFVTAYITFFTEYIFIEEDWLNASFPFIASTFVYIVITRIIGENQTSHAAIVYFKGILEYGLEEKEKEK